MFWVYVRGKVGINVIGDLYVSFDDEDISYIMKERLFICIGKIYVRIYI